MAIRNLDNRNRMFAVEVDGDPDNAEEFARNAAEQIIALFDQLVEANKEKEDIPIEKPEKQNPEQTYLLASDVLKAMAGAKSLGDAQRAVKKMQPARVKPDVCGRWIIVDDTEKFIAKCCMCGEIEDSRLIGRYCKHCGSRNMP